MHTEHIGNLHPGWVAGGWLVAVAVSSAAFLAFVGLGLMPAAGTGTAVWTALAVAIGFYAGGFFVGIRWSDAPVLHGTAITFLSVLVWFLGELFTPGRFAGLDGGAPAFVLGLVLLQLAASVAGGWSGRRMVRTGTTPDLDAIPPEA